MPSSGVADLLIESQWKTPPASLTPPQQLGGARVAARPAAGWRCCTPNHQQGESDGGGVGGGEQGEGL